MKDRFKVFAYRNQYWVQDTLHDVAINISGDFHSEDERREYCEMIVANLNDNG